MQTSRVISQSPSPVIVIKRLRTEKKPPKEKKVYTLINKIALDVCNGVYGNVDTGRREKINEKFPTIGYKAVQSVVNAANGNPDNIPYSTETVTENKYIGGVEFHREFSLAGSKILQSYQFSLSRSDVNGSFSLVFYPEDNGAAVFDDIEILDIVEIYETKLENFRAGIDSMDSAGFKRTVTPVFIGIVKRKKDVAQVTDSGIMKRLVVSGISVAGVVSQFFLNLDTTAMAITKQFICTEENRKKLTLDLINPDTPLKDVISKIWEVFKSLAEQCGTIAIQHIIDEFLIPDVFECDDTKFKFPIGNIPLGEQTQNFYSLINGILPEPVYENFATMDFESGKMKIVMRQVPFSEVGDIGTCWAELSKDARKIETREVKSFDLEQSDDEVYTVFFSYLSGYPLNTEKLMRIIAMQDDLVNPMVKYNEKKYQVYGYRPLIASFNGYAGNIKEDDSTDQNLTKTNELLAKWYGRLDEMLSGSITLAMTYDKEPILPGQVVKFLGGEFYVEGISHSWNYGNGGDVTISVSRGGKYSDNGEFSVLKNFTKNKLLLENAQEIKETKG